MAAVKFDRRCQLQGETFDSFVTDLKLLAWGLDMTETNKLIRNAIACKSLDERVRQHCLKKNKNLTLETAISIGWMFDATRDGLQVISGEHPRIEVSKVTWKKDSSRQHKKARNFKKPKSNNEIRNVTGVDTMHTSHKKSVQPRMNCEISAGKLDTLLKSEEVGKVLLTCWMKQTIRETNIPVMRKVLTGTYNY